ncbi:MAG TPA: GNVR domain-containing protein [Balneolales bacterium]|nr:GNVR domain-containing protein [Balneolales bacterium]
MDSNSHNQNINLLEILRVLYRWRKTLITNFIVISILAIVISLILPKKYQSTSVIIPPGPTSGLSAFLPSDMTTGLSTAIGGILGNASDQANKCIAILNSRTLVVKTIRKFDLMKRFGSPTIEDAIKTFKSNVNVTLNDDGTISITTTTETGFFHPHKEVIKAQHLCADISNYMVNQMDKKYVKLDTKQAHDRRILIGNRYDKNKKDLNAIAQRIKAFDEKNGMVSLPDQIKSTVSVASDLESKVIESQIALRALQRTFTSNQPEIKQKKIQISEMKQKLNQILTGPLSRDSLQVFPSFKEIPDLAVQYTELKREARVQEQLYEFLTQLYEQAKIQEAQDSPNIQIIDRGSIPTKRTSPRRSIIVILTVVAGMLLTCSYIFLADRMQRKGLNWHTIKHQIQDEET